MHPETPLTHHRRIAALVFAVTLVVWVIEALHWNSILDGDSALFPLMSLDVLRGHHYLYTAGQAHGGTPLVYLRALLFRFFGVSHFLGFFVNGIVLAGAAALWASFAARVSGPWAGCITGLLCAIGSSILAQYSCSDYYVLSLVCGGLMLQTAWTASKSEIVSASLLAWCGFLWGLSFYICRFTPLYAILAFGFFLALRSKQTRALLIPTLQELRNGRGRAGKLNRLLLAALVINTALFVPAFFTSDHFLGISAEQTLKWSVRLAAALWFLHRWRILVSPAPFVFIGGLVVGLVPHFAFKWLNPNWIDRSTGLVRWEDLGPLLGDVPRRVASTLSWSAPMSYGMAALAAAVALIALSARSRWTWVCLLLTTPIVAAWLLLHTYMYLPVQYLYPVLFPSISAWDLPLRAHPRESSRSYFCSPL